MCRNPLTAAPASPLQNQQLYNDAPSSRRLSFIDPALYQSILVTKSSIAIQAKTAGRPQ
jgi:hypothetical protein